MFIYHQPVEVRETLGCSIVAGLIRDKMGPDSKYLVSSARPLVVRLLRVGPGMGYQRPPRAVEMEKAQGRTDDE